MHSVRGDYRLEISEAALAQLRAMPKETRRRIGFRLEALQEGLQGDVTKLAGQAAHSRLRVGEYRVLFALEKDLIMAHQVRDRKDAYRD